MTPPIVPKEQLLSVGRIVHAYCHRGTERYGPIAALVVQMDPAPMVELHPGPMHQYLALTGTFWEVPRTPGLDADQTIRQYISWEWPPRH